jgi:hypothetical protein
MSYTQLTQGQRYRIYAMFIVGYNQTVITQVIVYHQTPIN